MKKIILTAVLICLFAAKADSQWTVVSQIPGNPFINVVSVVNAGVIWVCCDTGKVYRTTNGGVNWVARNAGLGTSNLYGISALDTSNCWIGDALGNIYHTTNGGLNWTLQLAIPGSFTNGIKMFSSTYGIYQGDPTGAGQSFQFRYTTNGGVNWVLSPNAPLSVADYGVVNAWDWLDTATVWIGSANTVSSATSCKVFKTTVGFGGGNWSTTLVNGSGTSQGLYYQGVAYTDANNGMIGSNNGALRKTTNGGTTWSVANFPQGITSFTTNNMNGMKDGTNSIRLSLIAAGVNKCFITSNLGTTWTEEVLPPLGQVNGIQHMQFISSSLGFAGGDNGVFMRYNGPSGIILMNNLTPQEFRLEQNFPNPFNPSTTINFSLPAQSYVTLIVYNSLGKIVRTLINQNKPAGNYSINFNSSDDLSSGVYFYKLIAENFSETKKMFLLK